MVNLRLTPAEYKKLQEAAAKSGLSISDFIRHVLKRDLYGSRINKAEELGAQKDGI
jgi:predicted HicB family RNase H-like nuclease